MTSNFDQAFNFTIGSEGGYVNDPNDPGGETKYGISKRSYPHEDIANLTLDRAREIYHEDFWQVIRGDDLRLPVAMVVFDGAVNSGTFRSAIWLQDALGVTLDGAIGPITCRAASRVAPDILVPDVLRLRLVFMQTLPNWQYNAKGWTRRLFKLAQAVGKVG